VTRTYAVFVAASLVPAAVLGETPARPQAAPPGAAPKAAAAPAARDAAPDSGYTYEARGRRDPFKSLIGAGEPAPAGRKPADGLGGLAAGDLAVRGIVQTHGALLAMVQAPDKKTYLVRQGDKLADGTIKAIDRQGLVILQDVNDPLSSIRQREIRRPLRSAEGAKP